MPRLESGPSAGFTNGLWVLDMSSTSVIIPCFNGQDYLPHALASVRAQTVPAREVIVVDDGSTEPVTVPSDWDGPPLTLIRTPNRGLPTARNTALDAARGEFVAYLDCDDWWHPEKLVKQEAALRADPSAVACYTRCHEGEGLFGFGPYPPIDVSDADFLVMLWHHSFFPPSSVMARRAITDQVGRFDPSMSMGEDIEHFFRLLAVGRFVQVPEPLTYYRVHPGQMTGSPLKRLRGWKQTRKAILRHNTDRLVAAGLKPDRLWAAHRDQVMLAFYRRQFAAARPLLWDYWKDHPTDWKVLVRYLVSCLPARWVSGVRGSVTTGPRPNQTAAGVWDTVFRELAPNLRRGG